MEVYMKILQQVKRFFLITILMTTLLHAELPEAIKELVKHEQTKIVLGKLYDHHMLGEINLQEIITKHFEPLTGLEAKKLLTAPVTQTEVQLEAKKIEKIEKEELALKGLKLDLNLALGKVTAAQTPKWLNIDVVNEMSMKVGRAQATKEFFFGNAGKFQVAAIMMAILAFVFRDKIKARIGTSIGEIMGHAFAGRGKKDLSGVVVDTIQKTTKNPETKKAVVEFMQSKEIQEGFQGAAHKALSGVSMKGAAKSVLADEEVGTLLNTRVENAVVNVVAGQKFNDALDKAVTEKMKIIETKFATVADVMLNVAANRLEAKTAELTSRISIGLGGVTLKPAQSSTTLAPTVTAALGLTPMTPVVVHQVGGLTTTIPVESTTIAPVATKSWWQFWK